MWHRPLGQFSGTLIYLASYEHHNIWMVIDAPNVPEQVMNIIKSVYFEGFRQMQQTRHVAAVYVLDQDGEPTQAPLVITNFWDTYKIPLDGEHFNLFKEGIHEHWTRITDILQGI